MSDIPKGDDAGILRAFEVCRAEIKHEYGVLANRLNSYMTSQAFLVSGYAISMGNMRPGKEGADFRLEFPLLLCTIAVVLCIRAYPGIAGACDVISRWHDRQKQLFDEDSGLDDYSVLRQVDVRAIHDRNLVFAQSSPWIFGVAWLLMAIIAIAVYR